MNENEDDLNEEFARLSQDVIEHFHQAEQFFKEKSNSTPEYKVFQSALNVFNKIILNIEFENQFLTTLYEFSASQMKSGIHQGQASENEKLTIFGFLNSVRLHHNEIKKRDVESMKACLGLAEAISRLLEKN